MKQFIASRLRNVCGVSVVELTTVLSATTILSGVAAPAIHDHLAEAKLVRARGDARVVAVSVVRMTSDVGALGRRPGGWAQYDLLVSAGEPPAAASPAATNWSAAERVGRLDDHLVSNSAGYAPPAGRGLVGWRGAYIDGAIGPDPWGHRYGINVAALATPGGLDTMVLSAGPDGTVDVPFATDGLREMGDDVLALVSSGSY